MELIRYSTNPVLLPDPTSIWETYNVFNPAVVYHQGEFHMLYRSQGLDWVSRLGYAHSNDGIHFTRDAEPVFSPHDDFDARGIEDPRITEINGVFYMTYTAYGNRPRPGFPPTHLGGSVTPMFAKSTNLRDWERIGPLVVGEDNKDHVLFPEKIGGKFVCLHRRPPQVWLARSDDLLSWPEEDMQPVFGPRPDNLWDSKRVGSGGVPIKTQHGWLLIYHAYDNSHVYRLGVCLLDLEDPTKVIRRPRDFIFEPREIWELRGDVPNVVFSGANVVVNNDVYVYYGAADHVVGLATACLDYLLEFALND
ncbi:MAG: glycosidase [Anaerolineaceae bacterium]